MKIHQFILCLAFITLALPAAQASGEPLDSQSVDQMRYDTPSGLPVPRFVALKNHKTYCRSGPSFAHPVRYTFMQKDAPVIVIAETVDHWRKVRDREGDECWAHKMVLKSPRKAFVLQEAAIRVKPDITAKIRAHLGKHALITVETTRNGWVRVHTGAMRGWIENERLWGVRGHLVQNTPSN